MESKFLLPGFGMLAFGLINLLWYLPISLSITLKNHPFPFDHLYNVVPSDGHGISHQIGYLPIDEAVNDPYWLAWSLALYGGMSLITFAIICRRN